MILNFKGTFFSQLGQLISATSLCSLTLLTPLFSSARIDIASLNLDQSEQSQLALEVLKNNLRINRPADLQAEVLVSADEKTETRRFFLIHPQAGSIQFLVQGPKGFTENKTKYSVTFLSAGFMTGDRAAQMLSSDGLLVAFSYPASADGIQKDPSLILKTLRIVPAQIALALDFIRNLNYVDANKFTVVGVSLGGLFMPVSLRLAQTIGFYPTRGTVLAYTGADLAAITRFNLQKYLPATTTDAVAQLIDALSSTHKPELHIPYLKGPILMIDASKDEIFPKESIDKLWSLIPEPKTRVTVDGPHINEDRIDMIAQTRSIIQKWVLSTFK